MESVRKGAGKAGALALVCYAACADADSTGTTPRVGDPALGAAAFTTSCAPCHASGDGFDLAFFGFADSVIVRRAVAHVDSATGRDIAAWIRTLGSAESSSATPPFQPAGTLAPDDQEFWSATIGAAGWPNGLTVDALRTLDLRDLALPLAFPRWSSEADESDWMPENPLPPAVAFGRGGALQQALQAYRASPTRSALVTAVEAFQAVTRADDRTDPALCAGGANEHLRPRECFEARRWMASLAAVHLLRYGGVDDVPFAVAELWWDTGEAAVSLYFAPERQVDRSTVAAWLVLGSVHAPGGFPGRYLGLAEDAGYMGQFLQSSGREHLALLLTLRRMVDPGPLHRAEPAQAYWDLSLAALRAPLPLVGDVLQFGLGYLEAELGAGRGPTGEGAFFALEVLRQLERVAQDRNVQLSTDVEADIDTRVARLRSGIGARVNAGSSRSSAASGG